MTRDVQFNVFEITTLQKPMKSSSHILVNIQLVNIQTQGATYGKVAKNMMKMDNSEE